MKLAFKHVSDLSITLMLEDTSVCQLECSEVWKKNLQRDIKKPINGPVFWFNRLKAKREGEGRGAFLMKELVKVLDEKGIWVFTSLNPYGRLNLEQLTKFYEKFGFISLDSESMYRPPKNPVFENNPDK